MELNLRTYVHDRAGVPGVWFYSLDANQWLAVKIARRFFHLPYEHARMRSTLTAEGRIRYKSLRSAGLAAWDEHLLALNGFAPTGHPPDHVILSRGVDVTIFPLERV
jgi:uncharacterized protein YqjF (DUF2071 family)